MSIIRDRVLEYLRQHPDGADDDEITRALGLKNRAQANERCRQLSELGLIERKPVGGKLRNFYAGTARVEKAVPGQEPAPVPAVQEETIYEPSDSCHPSPPTLVGKILTLGVHLPAERACLVKHSASCRACKETIARLLAKTCGQVDEQHLLKLPARLEGYKRVSCYEALAAIHERLERHRGHHGFVRARELPRVDFFLPRQRMVVEFDELQHFTAVEGHAL